MCLIPGVLFIITTLIHPSFAFGNMDKAYGHRNCDMFTIYNDWMKSLDEDLWLSELAIPGTHDSASSVSWIQHVNTQVLDFKRQIQFGIRFFDIRIRHTGDRFALHHGSFFLNKMFGDFLNTIDDFLSKNPSETILFRLREEQTADDNNTRSIKKTLEFYLNQYRERFLKTNTNVKLRTARGKFIIFSDNTNFHDFDIKYIDSEIQDFYQLFQEKDVLEKWNRVKNHLVKAVNGDKNKFYINFLSGSGAKFSPLKIAGGFEMESLSKSMGKESFHPGGFFQGIDTFARDAIQNVINRNFQCFGNGQFKRSVGIIVADYPGTSLIKEIIDNNKSNCSQIKPVTTFVPRRTAPVKNCWLKFFCTKWKFTPS